MPKPIQAPFSTQAGKALRHGQGRTLTQTDNTWYTLLTLNTANHFDLARGARAEFGQVLMNSTFTFAVAIGLMSRDFGDDLLQRMTLHEVKLVKTMFAGDTLYVVSVFGEPDDERVPIVSTGYNQAQEAVIEIRWEYDLRPLALLARLEAALAAAPRLDPDRQFALQIHAPAFEDFTIGARHDHETGRTMLRDESIWMSLLSMRHGEAYHDLVAAKALGLPDILVDETFVLSTILGLGVKHATQKAVANLGWRNIRFWRPVYPGDTIYSESVVTGARLSASRPGQGVVSLETIGRNQRDEVVATYARSFLTYCRAERARKNL